MDNSIVSMITLWNEWCMLYSTLCIVPTEQGNYRLYIPLSRSQRGTALSLLHRLFFLNLLVLVLVIFALQSSSKWEPIYQRAPTRPDPPWHEPKPYSLNLSFSHQDGLWASLEMAWRWVDGRAWPRRESVSRPRHPFWCHLSRLFSTISGRVHPKKPLMARWIHILFKRTE
mgnify:CR=1 FL=1